MRARQPDAENLRLTRLDMPTGTGFSNETVFFDVATGVGKRERVSRYVARVEQGDGPLFPVQSPSCEVSVYVQYRAMQVVSAACAAPVPPVVAYEGDLSVLDRPFFVMEFVAGEIPADVPRYSQAGFLVDEAKPADRERMVFDGIDKMAEIAALDWQQADLDWLDASQGTGARFARQIDVYRDFALNELDGREHPVLLRSLDWLGANAPDAELGLSWGDARLGNMIWQDYRCAGVLDWEAASIAPAEADIGWWLMFDRMSFDDLDAPRLEGFPTREAMVEHWQRRVGRDVLGGIDYWEIFGAMRFCAIMVKLGDRLTGRGLAPVEANLSVDNGTTDALARLLARQGA